MRNDLSKAQVDEFQRLDAGEDTSNAEAGSAPHALAVLKQLSHHKTHQIAEDVVRVSREFYFPKAPEVDGTSFLR